MSTRKKINLGIAALIICTGALLVGKMNADAEYHDARRDAERHYQIWFQKNVGYLGIEYSQAEQRGYSAWLMLQPEDHRTELAEIARDYAAMGGPWETSWAELENSGKDFRTRLFGYPSEPPLLSGIPDSAGGLMVLVICGGLICLGAQGAWLIVLYCIRTTVQEIHKAKDSEEEGAREQS